MLKFTSILVSAVLSASLAAGQLNTTVGPTTSAASKRATICNVLDYGGIIGSSDIGESGSLAFFCYSPDYHHFHGKQVLPSSARIRIAS